MDSRELFAKTSVGIDKEFLSNQPVEKVFAAITKDDKGREHIVALFQDNNPTNPLYMLTTDPKTLVLMVKTLKRVKSNIQGNPITVYEFSNRTEIEEFYPGCDSKGSDK